MGSREGTTRSTRYTGKGDPTNGYLGQDYARADIRDLSIRTQRTRISSGIGYVCLRRRTSRCPGTAWCREWRLLCFPNLDQYELFSESHFHVARSLGGCQGMGLSLCGTNLAGASSPSSSRLAWSHHIHNNQSRTLSEATKSNPRLLLRLQHLHHLSKPGDANNRDEVRCQCK